ncbi:MAG TPA: SGNH/GDSL hydrolase family protein [Terracidiphilus sp.]
MNDILWKFKNQVLASLVAPLFALCPVIAQNAPVAVKTTPYTLLYVFGDSYSDSGSGYVDCNGPTAVVYLARRLSIPFTYYGDPQSMGKGLNFAVSAAQTGEDPGRRFPAGMFFALGMKNQVDNFVHFSKRGYIPKIDPQNTMFFFAGGLNDEDRPDGFTRTNIESEIETLYEVGARRFMVAVLPEKIPAFAALGTKLNQELKRIPDEERAKHADIRISNSQWGAFFDEVIMNPSNYGFRNTIDFCARRSFSNEPVKACAEPGTYFYYHEAHPSTAAHRAVGEMLYQEAITSAP